MHLLTRHAEPLAATAVAALLAGLWLVAGPPTPDLAAQVYRTGLFRAEGFTLVNPQWYAGHHVPGYSLSFPPLAALVGPRVVGALAAVASAVLFALLARAHFGARARVGILWFAAATTTDLLIGRLTFGLGVTAGLAALLALQRGHGRLALVLAVATTVTSPVAGLFLAMAGTALYLARREPAGLRVAAAAFVPAVALAVLFPEGGAQPWGGRSFAVLLVALVAVAALLPRAERALRAGALLYLAAAVAAFAVATPMGSNATRLGALFAGPVLACALAGRGRARVLVAVAVPLLVWQWYGPIREAAKGATDPSAEAGFYAGLLERLEGEAAAGTGPARIEIPFTRLHWESVHVARRFALARGWETQLDVERNAIFRAPGALTAERYQHWLMTHGVRHVALPDVPLDPAGRAEARLIRRGLPFLELVWSDRNWRLYRVRGARGLVVGDAAAIRMRADGFTLAVRRPGPVTVRLRHSPYWTVVRGAGCVAAAPGGWTRVHARHAGPLRVAARFRPARILARPERCPSGR